MREPDTHQLSFVFFHLKLNAASTAQPGKTLKAQIA
jgi:hypothetical protein